MQIDMSAAFDIPVTFFPATPPTDREGRLKRKYAFNTMVFRFRGNTFTVSIPDFIFEKLSRDQRMELADYMIQTFWEAMISYESLFYRIPEGYKFNVVFGKTAEGHPFNLVYRRTSRSNIYPDCLPFNNNKDMLTPKEKYYLLHEIGHGLFAIVLGNLIHPRNKSIEEGTIDHLLRSRLDIVGYAENPKYDVPPGKLDEMEGLTQLDVEISLWGKERVLSKENFKGYAGYTHHEFGMQFVDAFLANFYEEDLAEFLRRLRALENTIPENDYGSRQVREILYDMGYTDVEINRFRDDLHSRLKANVFK